MNNSDHEVRRFKTLVDNLPGMAYRCQLQNNKWNKTYISNGSLDLLGYAPESLINSKDVEFDDLIHEADREAVWSSIEYAIQRHKHFEITYRIWHKTLGLRWVWERGRATYHNDNVIEIEGFVTDITIQKSIETNLTHQKLLLWLILDSLAENVVVIDKHGIIQTVNKSWTDFARENNANDAVTEGVGINYLAICSKSVVMGDPDAEIVMKGIVSVLDGSVSDFVYEYPCHSPEKQRWFRMHVSKLDVADTGAVISHIDITNLWLAQNNLRHMAGELEKKVARRTYDLNRINADLQDEIRRHKETGLTLQQFKSALDSSSDSIYLIDPVSMKFIDVNRMAWEALGYTRDEILEMGPEDIKPKSIVAELHEKFHQVLSGLISEAVIETTHCGRNGKLIPVEVRIRKAEVGDHDFLVAVARDITDRKKAESVVLASEQRFRLLFDNLPLGVALADKNGCYTLVNKSMCNMLGYTVDELTSGMSFNDVTHPDDVGVNLSLFNHLHESGSSGFSMEKRYIRKTGDIIWSNIIIKLVHKPDGRVMTLGIHQDITEKKKSELALLESRETLRALLDAAEDDYFMLLDKDGVVIELNQSMARSIGVQAGLVIGKSVFDCFSNDVAARRRVWMDIVLEKKSPVSFEDQRDGRFFHTKIYPILDKQDNIFRIAIFARDITDIRMAAERRVAQERKHKEVLVREVHHRIKNNLQSVAGLLRRQKRLQPIIDDVLQEAIGQVEVVALVHGLQGSAGEGHLYLCDMVPSIARTAIELDRMNVSYNFTNLLPNMFTIIPEESVPVALIMNELITNALKHSGVENKVLNICLKYEYENKVGIYIENYGFLSEAFNFSQNLGLGTGLALVRSLMPQKGVEIMISQMQDKVVAHVLLDKSVVTLDPRLSSISQ